MKQFYTYLHCKPDCTPFYVGKGMYNRAYIFSYGRNKHHQNIVAKYGEENIRVFVFPCDSEEQAFKDEIQQIAQLRKEGYELCNLTDGGEGSSGIIVSKETRLKKSMALKGIKPSDKCLEAAIISSKNRIILDATRMKLSSSSKGNKKRLGKYHSEEAKLKISIAKKGTKLSEETKEKMRASAKPITPEHREKMRLARIGKGKKKDSKETCEKRSATLKAIGHKPSALCHELSRKASIGRVVSEETREKIRQAHLGKKQSLETIEKRTKSNIGKKRTLATRLKMSIVQKQIAEQKRLLK